MYARWSAARLGCASRPSFRPLIDFRMAGTPAITTQNLTRRFGSHLAVDQVDLDVPPRTVYGFLGPNGAGKSTTIRMLLGLLRPDRGRVHLLGRSLTDHRKALLHDVGALVEAPSVYDHLTGRENLDVTARLRGGVSESAIERALEIVELRAAADRRAGTYSLGMKQRLGLATALLDEPKLLILDEPTNGLDPAGMREIRTLLRRLPTRAGVTVFLSSHLLGEVVGIVATIFSTRIAQSEYWLFCPWSYPTIAAESTPELRVWAIGLSAGLAVLVGVLMAYDTTRRDIV